MARNNRPHQLDSLRTWIRIWVALTIGSFLGSSIVPIILEKSRTDGSWFDAVGYGGYVLLNNWLPTIVVFSLIGAAIIYPLWRKGVLS